VVRKKIGGAKGGGAAARSAHACIRYWLQVVTTGDKLPG